MENIEMPTPCVHCGELFELHDGYESKKWHLNITICKNCQGEEMKEIAIEEEIEDLVANISHAEDNIIRYRKKLVSLGYVFHVEKNKKTCIEDNAEKAEKWDNLDADIGAYYEDLEQDEEEVGDLCDIGGIAARAFGYL